LEARLESARRASEIHKRRTGKALRVTEADVQNEEMYEEEDDLPASFAYGLGSAANFEFRMRMQAYYEQQLALRNAMAYASAGGNLNAIPPPPPITLRDYYTRFAQQYPLTGLSSNQYLFPPPQMPATMAPNLAQPSAPMPVPGSANPSSPSISSTKSSSPAKSPVVNHSRRVSSSVAPYSSANSQRHRRASSNTNQIPSAQSQIQHPSVLKTKIEPDFQQTNFHNDYTTQSFQTPIHPFSTQLPTHLQQYNLADFVDPMPTIPVQSIAMEKAAPTDEITATATDFFTTSSEWADFISQNQQAPSKITPYDDGTNWDDYLQGDANWIFASQSEQEQ